MLWPVLDKIFRLDLRYDNSHEAVNQRKQFLAREKLGICDIVASCQREKIDASDLGMQDIQLRNIFAQLKKHPTITRLLFTGGRSRNGPEYLFRRQCSDNDIPLLCTSPEPPKEHTFAYRGRTITTVSLISPSNAANMAIGSTALYKSRKKENPAYSTFDFRVDQYRKIFLR